MSLPVPDRFRTTPRRPIACALATSLCLFALSSPARSELLVAPDGKAHLALDDSHSLIVRNPEPGKITAEIYRNGYFRSGLMFGNAMFDGDDLGWVRLCAECDRVVFLRVHDQSSTYGAIVGVVIWMDWPNWQLSELPLMRPYVTAPDLNGLSRLMDNALDAAGNPVQIEYRFVKGHAERLP